MDLTLSKNTESLSSPQTEQVQKQKHEFKLLGSFLRTKGLKLFSYNSIKNELREVEIEYGDTLHLFKVSEKEWVTIDFDAEKCFVDSRNEHFEALNMNNAIRRVNKYKRGDIDNLCNLRDINGGELDLKFW